MSYDLGDAVPLVYTLENTATVALTVTDPDGDTQSPTVAESGTAPLVTYTAAVLADKVGLWAWSFVATVGVNDAESGHFYVQPAPTDNVYTTLPEVKSALSIPPSDVADDDDLADAIRTASRSVDGDCQRHFHQVAEVRTLPPPRDGRLLRLGDFGDLVSVTSLATGSQGDGTWPDTWTTTDFQLLTWDDSPNVNAGPEPRPYRKIRAVGSMTFPTVQSSAMRADLIRIDGVWGWPAVPDRIRRAARLLAVEVFKLKDAPLGAAGVGDLGIIRVRESPRYLSLISPYRLSRYPVR